MKRGKPRGGLTDGCGSPQIPCFLGGRSFMGAGNKTTFMMTKARPEGRPYAPTHVSESLIVGRQAGLSIASWGGVRGPFRWNFTLYIRLFVYVIKSPRLHSHAPPARDRKPQRALSPWFLGRAGTGNRAGQLPALQPRGPRSRQQFTALRLNCLPCRNGGRARVGRVITAVRAPSSVFSTAQVGNSYVSIPSHPSRCAQIPVWNLQYLVRFLARLKPSQC